MFRAGHGIPYRYRGNVVTVYRFMYYRGGGGPSCHTIVIRAERCPSVCEENIQKPCVFLCFFFKNSPVGVLVFHKNVFIFLH